MILVAGGSGRLGTALVPLLTARGLQVRILTRDPARASHLEGGLVEVVAGDVTDPEAVARAVAGVTTVVSAVQGFGGPHAQGVRTVDEAGNRTLIRAARAAGVEQFVLVSVAQASATHPIEHFRAKFAAEQELRASGLGWTIIQPTAYMELFVDLVGGPLLATGTTRVFGRGDNPINMVSAHDVARFVDLAVTDPAMRGRTVEVAGPANVTLNELAEAVRLASGRPGTVRHVPRLAMRLLATILRPVNPIMAGIVRQALVIDTRDMRVDTATIRAEYPSMPATALGTVIARTVAAAAAPAAVSGPAVSRRRP